MLLAVFFCPGVAACGAFYNKNCLEWEFINCATSVVVCLEQVLGDIPESFFNKFISASQLLVEESLVPPGLFFEKCSKSALFGQLWYKKTLCLV